jgi:CheY-like chemotaxis protein
MKKLAVLVVDDTASIRELLTAAFTEAGCHVLAADGGNEGFAILSRVSVDLLITDLRMENGTGVELIRRLRRIKKAGGRTPEIIVYTGLCSKDGESYLKSLGAAVILSDILLSTSEKWIFARWFTLTILRWSESSFTSFLEVPVQ